MTDDQYKEFLLTYPCDVTPTFLDDVQLVREAASKKYPNNNELQLAFMASKTTQLIVNIINLTPAKKEECKVKMEFAKDQREYWFRKANDDSILYQAATGGFSGGGIRITGYEVTC